MPSLKRVPNLDAISLNELRRYRQSIRRRGDHYDQVRRYCRYKQEAMELRLAGFIQNALLAEKVCDQIYTTHLQGKVDW